MNNSEKKIWDLSDLPGDGRGTIFSPQHSHFTDELSGLKILKSDNQDPDDEDWDDFSHQWYWCTAEGTEEQVKKFIKEHFYGEGHYCLST